MGGAACRGTAFCTAASTLLGLYFSCAVPGSFTLFVPHLMLAVLEGITTSTPEGLETSVVFCQC